MSGFLLNLHVWRCNRCRTMLNNLSVNAALPFLCRRGWMRVKKMLRANGVEVPTYPSFVEEARP